MTAATRPRLVEADWTADDMAELDRELGDETHEPPPPAWRPLASIDRSPPAPLLLGRLDPTGHTILFGTGDVGKGTIATWWISRLTVLEGRRVLILDYEYHPEEWARRYHGLAGKAGVDAVLHVSPGAPTWAGTRGPIWEQLYELAEILDETRADVLVVDSIVTACAGADPMDPGTAAQYALALQYLEVPVLSLAHVTKADDVRYPFGSIFWHNLARVTWSMTKDGDRRILTSRKANNYGPQGRFVATITWHDGLPRDVHEQGYSQALADRIDEVLVAAMPVARIVALLNEDAGDDVDRVKPDSIRAALRRGLSTDPKRFTVEGAGDGAVWSRAS